MGGTQPRSARCSRGWWRPQSVCCSRTPLRRCGMRRCWGASACLAPYSHVPACAPQLLVAGMSRMHFSGFARPLIVRSRRTRSRAHAGTLAGRNMISTCLRVVTCVGARTVPAAAPGALLWPCRRLVLGHRQHCAVGDVSAAPVPAPCCRRRRRRAVGRQDGTVVAPSQVPRRPPHGVWAVRSRRCCVCTSGGARAAS